MKRASVLLVTVAMGCGGDDRRPAEPSTVEIEATSEDATAMSTPQVPNSPASLPQTVDQCIAAVLRAQELVAAAGGAGDPAADLYVRALDELEEGDRDEAQRTLLTLVETHKSSELVPYAYLHFGELFFLRAKTEPRMWSVAGNFFRQVTKYPNEHTRSLAHIRGAEVEEARGEHGEAVAQYAKAARSLQAGSGPCRDVLLAEVERGLVRTYPEVGDPAKRCAFFAKVLPNRPCP